MDQQKNKLVTAVYRYPRDAERALRRLRDAGFGADRVNALMAEATREIFHPYGSENTMDQDTHAPEGAVIGGTVGSALGAAVGAVAAIGSAVVIPGVGLAIAGPLAAGLIGAGMGAVTGSLVGGLMGLGIPQPRAEAYQQILNQGGIVVALEPHSNDEAVIVQQILTETGGEDVTYH